MILLVGERKDSIIRYLCQYLIKKDVEVFFFDTQKICLGNDISSDYITICNDKFKFSDFKLVFNRLNNLHKPNTKEFGAINYLNYSLNFNFDTVLNKPKNSVSNFSKMLQLIILNTHYLLVPYSIVLNNTKPYQKGINEDYIFKSISCIRSIVCQVDRTFKNKYISEPVMFQEYIRGVNIRVHVVGTQISALMIKAPDIDYRYSEESKRQYSSIDLPKEIQKECIEVTRSLGLVLSGIDLLKLDDKYYILEINPSPAYVFFEKRLGSDEISNMIFNYYRDLL